MGFKCALQIMGLTRGEPTPNAKHRMNLRKATMEAGYERASHSATLDRRRSHMNEYSGYTKGAECADMMEAESEFITVHLKDGTDRKRKSRSDCVPGFAVICNPPYEVCYNWTDEQYKKFYQDSWECLCEFRPEIFRDENITMTAEHFDEGVPPEEHRIDDRVVFNKGEIDRHKHFIGFARDTDGKWIGNEIDAKFFVDLNRVYPQMMRDRGWDMDELNTTDWERAKVDTEYRQARNEQRRRSGRSVNQHLIDKLHNSIQNVEKVLDDAEELKSSAQQMKETAKEEFNREKQDTEYYLSLLERDARQDIEMERIEAEVEYHARREEIAEELADIYLERNELDKAKQCYLDEIVSRAVQIHQLLEDDEADFDGKDIDDIHRQMISDVDKLHANAERMKSDVMTAKKKAESEEKAYKKAKNAYLKSMKDEKHMLSDMIGIVTHCMASIQDVNDARLSAAAKYIKKRMMNSPSYFVSLFKNGDKKSRAEVVHSIDTNLSRELQDDIEL